MKLGEKHAYFFSLFIYLFIYIYLSYLFTMTGANRFAKQSTRTT